MSMLGTTGTRLTVATSLALTIAFGSSGFAASGPTSGKDAKEKGLEFQKGYAPVNRLRIYGEIHGCRPRLLKWPWTPAAYRFIAVVMALSTTAGNQTQRWHKEFRQLAG